MQKKIVWQWEYLDNHEHSKTARCKVIGGWLVNHVFVGAKGQQSESMVFVADRDHEWMAIPPPKEEQPPAEKLAGEFSVPV